MSSEKRYKHIEDKIAAAADAAEYAFNEASWQKMEALLDKSKDRRRPFFWIFSFVILGTLIAGGVIMYQSNNKTRQSPVTVKRVDNKNKNDQQPQPSGLTNDIVTVNQPVSSEKNTDNNNAASAKADTNKNFELITNANKKPQKTNTYKIKIKKQHAFTDHNQAAVANLNTRIFKNRKPKTKTGADNYKAVNKNIYKDKHKFSVNITAPELIDEQDKTSDKTDVNINTYLADTKNTKAEDTAADLTKKQAINKPDTVAKKTNPITKATDKKEKKKKEVSGLYIFGAAGAEASSTKFFSYKNSTIAPGYGLGFGYQLNRHLSVQAAFYAAAKKYIAGPNDYNVKAGSYLSTVKIIKVDANCMVYEVPVSIQYNWLIKPKANYYVALGLSSYIMKKEKYNYTFERNYTQYTYPYDYTKNSHLFAALQFSLGMEKQIGRKFYIQAAPTVSLPLQGVGEGSVKIFTTRLQVGLKYLPFR